MAVNDIVVQEFVNAIKEPPQDTNKTYNATVSHIDGEGVVWVNIHGSDKETPTASTSTEVKRGDNVTVQWRNNKLYIGGNYSNPSAGFYSVQPSVDFVSELVDKDITVNSINAATGYIGELTSEKITTGDIQAGTGYIKELKADNIEAEDIIADHADIGDLKANKADIDLLNVDVAWIEQGNIKKAEVFDENVFDLSGNRATIARIDASKINVANLRADNLVVRRINGQPVVGGYTLIDSNSPQYETKNPQALGWYEFVNAEWVLSTDTTVDMTKAYYQEGNEVSLYDQAYIDALENDLQQQIDGAVETFTGSVVPTLVNYPYTDWYDTSITPIHDERAKHVGDIYYVTNSALEEDGYAYRFAFDETQHAYDWILIKDSDVTKALSDISELQTFESETTSWIEETDEGLETIRTNHTALSGVVDKTVKESVQLWFTKANTTAPAKPTAEVTSTSTAGNAWRKVVPAYNASYPNYYYCWQYKFVDGTFGWSDVVRDIAMGETQGTARDAKNTADAALPASTFTTFESTTFKNVKDTVDEQSTKFTNMTTRLGLNSDGTGANTDIVAKESALEQTVDGVSTRVGKTEMHLAGMYATSSTAAGTAAKVATIVPTLSDYELTKGAMVTVKFTAANTTASPTLNLNGTGAKAIKTYSGGNLTEAEYKWKAGSTFTFTYNGTNWLMQDSTASVRMTNAETEIQQTADNVLIKATKSDTTAAQGGQHLIQSLINVAPDGVTIDADKVNITGTTVFSDGTSIQSRVDAVEVGGRNILLNSEQGCLVGYQNTPTVTTGIAIAEWGATNAIRYKGTGGSNNNIFAMFGGSTARVSQNPILSIDGQYYTYSAYIKNNHASNTVYFKPNHTKDAIPSAEIAIAPNEAKWCVVSTKGNASGNVQLNFRNSAVSMAYDITVWHPKIEYGNKATDWTPAPEDVQAEIDAKKSVHTLMTANSAGANYTAILSLSVEGYSGNWGVVSTSGVKVGDTVRIGYPVSDMSMSVIYVVGTVTAINSSTNLTMTSHGLDTTIIDGGNILTNSIGANQIGANAITVGKMDSDTQSQVLNSEIQVGGRNLFGYGSDLQTSLGGLDNYGDGFSITTEGGFKCAHATGALNTTKYLRSKLLFTPKPLETFTFSGHVKLKSIVHGTTNPMCEFYFSGATIDSAWRGFSVEAVYIDGVKSSSTSIHFYDHQITDNKWHHIAVVAHFNYSGTSTIPAMQPSLYLRDCTGDLYFHHVKFERGNKATDWTAAPEDASGTNLLSYPYFRDTISGSPFTTNGITYTLNKDGSITAKGTATANAWYSLTYSNNANFPNGQFCLPAGTYVISGCPSGGAGGTYRINVGAYTIASDGTTSIASVQDYGNGVVLTLSEAAYIRIEILIYNGHACPSAGYTFRPMLEVGEVAHRFASPAATSAAAESATQYITRINADGIYISPASQSPSSGAEGDSVKIDGSGMNVYLNGTSIAQYGSTARIGKDASPHVSIDANGFHIWKAAQATATNEVASFTNTTISLGKNNLASTIEMCKGALKISTSTSNSFVSTHITARADDSTREDALEIKAGLAGASISMFGNGDISIEGNASASVSMGLVSAGGFAIEESTTSYDVSAARLSYCDALYLNSYDDSITTSLWYENHIPYAGSQAYAASWQKIGNDYRLGRPSSSSRRYKEDIQPVVDDRLDPHRLYDIEVVQFKFKEGYFEQDDPYEQDRKDVIGFIAEDVYEHYPQAAIMLDDDVENWDERYIIPPMLKLIQEQNDRITELERRLS